MANESKIVLKAGSIEHSLKRHHDRLAYQHDSGTKEFKRAREEGKKRQDKARNQVIKNWNQKRRLATD